MWELLSACRRHPVHDWVATSAVKAHLQARSHGAAATAAEAVQHAWRWFCRRRLALHPTLPWAKTLRKLGKGEHQASLVRRELPCCPVRC